jgi:hypothetical protein
MLKTWVVEPTTCRLCGKKQYDDEEDAVYSIPALDPFWHAYKCPYGNGWHLSSTPRGRLGESGLSQQP